MHVRNNYTDTMKNCGNDVVYTVVRDQDVYKQNSAGS